MSYTISAYLVNLDDIRNVYGSNDSSLVEDIEKRLVQEISSMNILIEEEWDIEVPSLQEVLRSNVAGEFPWPYAEAPYKEVLRLLCLYFGEKLPNELLSGMSPYGVKFIEDEFDLMSNIIFHSNPPVAIPGMEDENMYRVGHISFDDIKGLLENNTSTLVYNKEEPDIWEQQVYTQFKNWLDEAAQYHKGIITFFD